MSDFLIPHQPPIKFAQRIISSQKQECLVEVAFETLPTLGMLIESAAQSSLALLEEDREHMTGFLVSLKNVKLLKNPTSKSQTLKVELVSNLGGFKAKKFEVFEEATNLIAVGEFAVMLQEK